MLAAVVGAMKEVACSRINGLDQEISEWGTHLDNPVVRTESTGARGNQYRNWHLP